MSLTSIGLSFVEGLGLIASPCILPVLPLVLSSSVDGGRKRPFGIITGFVIAFTLFALLSRKLVLSLGIDLDIIKYGSLILLAFFGVVLLSESLSARFSLATQRFANLVGGLSTSSGQGFLSGILIGTLIGLVWTPCAGPILAAVLVQIIREQNDLSAFVLVAFFALGAGVPMLVIALTGRRVMARLGFFTHHAEAVRKAFGVIILAAVVFIASGFDPQTLFTRGKVANLGSPSSAANSPVSATGLEGALAKPYPAPEFAGLDGWLNSDPLTLASLKGKVVLVDFWTYSCINCLRTLPTVIKWDADYRDKGLVIIGIHSPEFEFEKSRANVEAALKARGITYPVALDSHLDTWTAFRNQYWPAHYLIDKSGQVVYTHFGEGHYTETENNIRYLLGLDRKTDIVPEAKESTDGETPETYLGYERGDRFASNEDIEEDKPTHYTASASLDKNWWALSGDWKVEPERIVSAKANATLRFHIHAGKVFLVLGTRDHKPLTASVTFDGKPLGDLAGKDDPGGKLIIKDHTLYELLSGNKPNDGVIEIAAGQEGLEAYAFTFGN